MTDPKKASGTGGYDEELYGDKQKGNHHTTLAMDDSSDEEDELQKKLKNELLKEGDTTDVFADKRAKTIADRESDYQKRNRLLAAERFEQDGSYEDRMARVKKDRELDDELTRLRQLENEKPQKQKDAPVAALPDAQQTKRSRWDTAPDPVEPKSEWDTDDTTPHRKKRWDTPTPGRKTNAGLCLIFPS